MRVCLLYNPCNEVAERIAVFINALQGGSRCELMPTRCSGDAIKLAKVAVEEGFDRIVVAGGDGMINQAICGIAPHFDSIEMAVLPFGTGNDLARALGIFPDRLDLACRDALDDRVEAIDVIRLRGNKTSYCINVANGGFGGRVAVDVQSDDKRRWGPIAYWMSSFSHLAEREEFQLSLDVDGQRMDFTTMGLAIANGRYVGGGFPIAPTALLNDGKMDVIAVPSLPTLELMSAGLGFTMGQQHEGVRIFQARHLRFDVQPAMPFSIDGEPAEEYHADFDLLPQVLRVAVGEQAPGLTPAPTEG